MKVSVIIPVYNAAAFVERAVESAVTQPEVSEVILVEDGSAGTDLAACERIVKREQNVHLLRHPNGANRGAGESRNLGMRQASSALIAFLDADDVYLPNRFVQDIGILSANQEIEGVYNAIGERCYSADLATWTDNFDRLTTVTASLEPSRLVYEMGPLGPSGHFHLDGLTVRRESLSGVRPFGTFKLSQDTEWILRLAFSRRLVAGSIDRPVALRGVHVANRIADRSAYEASQAPVWRALFRWSCNPEVPSELAFAIWQIYFRHEIRVGQHSTNGSRVMVLKSAFECPKLLGVKEFRAMLPGWKRMHVLRW